MPRHPCIQALLLRGPWFPLYLISSLSCVVLFSCLPRYLAPSLEKPEFSSCFSCQSFFFRDPGMEAGGRWTCRCVQSGALLWNSESLLSEVGEESVAGERLFQRQVPGWGVGSSFLAVSSRWPGAALCFLSLVLQTLFFKYSFFFY